MTSSHTILASQLVSPCIGPNDEKEYGLTKRELFAAMALQGLATQFAGRTLPELARAAVDRADALLEALSDEPHTDSTGGSHV